MTSQRSDKYILKGKVAVPVYELEVWAKWYETADRHVCKTYIGPIYVSTVFLSLDHNFGMQGPPLLFETMAFCGDGEDNYQTRCSTWDQALKMHDAAVPHFQRIHKDATAITEKAIEKLLIKGDH